MDKNMELLQIISKHTCFRQKCPCYINFICIFLVFKSFITYTININDQTKTYLVRIIAFLAVLA